MMLETRLHAASWFATLTYAPECLPSDGSVSPVALQLFMKRLRAHVSPERIRFYGVGEYGDQSQRPHYHLALFGLSDPDAIAKCWHDGFAHVGFLTEQSAAYIVGYVTKGMTREEDERLKGRHPEFARMSRRPGIGAGAVDQIAAAVEKGVGWDVYLGESAGDVPSGLRSEQRMWPLGRYLRQKLRTKVGVEKSEPTEVFARRSRELQEELLAKGGRVKRESKRESHARRAKFLDTVKRLKKGL